MKILSIDTDPLIEIPYFNAGRRAKDFYVDRLPVYRAIVDELPESLDAMVVTADLQGLDIDPMPGNVGLPLLGCTLPTKLEPILDGLDVCWNKVAALLAGDFYTYPDLHGRGGTGDVTEVWDAFADAYQWVVGVAGNHDTFGDRESYLPKMHSPDVHLLDADRVEMAGLSIAGISGIIGNPRKNFRRDHYDFVETLDLILQQPTDIALMHTGPDFPDLQGCKGVIEIREIIEKRTPSIVVRGHCHWPQPLVQMDCGTQILNVDATTVILIRG